MRCVSEVRLQRGAMTPIYIALAKSHLSLLPTPGEQIHAYSARVASLLQKMPPYLQQQSAFMHIIALV